MSEIRNNNCKVAVVGRGNVGSHLHNALKEKTEVKIIDPHTLEGINDRFDFIIVSVKDNAINEVLARLAGSESIVAHTSGSTPIDIFEGKDIKRFGVFYPMQTFSKEVPLNYEEIPFFIEANSDETTRRLMNLASLVSKNIYEADSEKRKKLHLASVFACNFVNHLWTISDRILSDSGIDFSSLIPLIKETTSKLSRTSPFSGQTGPAVRNDSKILEIQRDQLRDYPNFLKIYNLISESIIETHKDKDK